MALSDTGYSRLVTTLKIALPLIALTILSTLFYLARPPDLERTIPFADIDLETLAREPRISEPDFSGVTPNGIAVTLRARSARPDPDDPGRFLADGMMGEFRTDTGERISITSEGGVVDTGTGLATLAGDVLLQTSLGYAIRTDELSTRLDSTRTESTGPVDIAAPFGHLTAGRLVVTQVTDQGSSYQLVFTDGVDLIYQP